MSDLPVMDEFEADDLSEAVKKAETGRFDHTLFEIWESILEEALLQSQTLTIPYADALLRQWPWLRYPDLDKYLEIRSVFIREATDTLRSCYPEDKTIEQLFSENEDDWTYHKDIYLDIIVAWTRLCNAWAEVWKNSDTDRPVFHAAVSDMTALLINPQMGLVENVRNLAGFEISEEDGAALTERIKDTEDE